MSVAEPSNTTNSGITRTVIDHLCAVFRGSELIRAPFAHVYVQPVFPPEVYAEMLSLFPGRDHFRALSETKYRLPDGTSTRDLLQLEPPFLNPLPARQRELWEAVSAALRSTEVKDAVFECLAEPLARRFRVEQGSVGSLKAYPRPALIRDRGGYEISPHPDTSSKIVTLQFYLPPDDSQLDYGTSLYRRRLLKLENLTRPKRRFEEVKQLPFRPNSGYGFVVTRSSWHGRQRLPLDGSERHTVLNIYYNDPNKAY